MKDIFKGSPLFSAWNIFGTVSGVLSLSSLAENIIQWKGFFSGFVDFYQSIVHTAFSFIFSWLPFGVPTFVFDYLALGIIVLAISSRVASKVGGGGLKAMIQVMPGYILLWPIILVLYIVIAFNISKNEGDRLMGIYFTQLLTLNIFCFMILFILNLVLFSS